MDVDDKTPGRRERFTGLDFFLDLFFIKLLFSIVVIVVSLLLGRLLGLLLLLFLLLLLRLLFFLLVLVLGHQFLHLPLELGNGPGLRRPGPLAPRWGGRDRLSVFCE